MSDPQQPPYGAVPPVPPSSPAPPPYTPGAPGFAAPGPTPAPTSAPTQTSTPFPVPQAAPPGAYQVPVGGYAPGVGSYQVPAPAEKKSGVLGILSLVLALVAAVVVPIVGAVSGVEIGRRLPGGIDTNDPEFLRLLSPAREQVLWAEISFWTGTVLGIAAIVLGIIAIRRRQGRGAGIGALVVAALGPVIYWVVLIVAISIGIAAGVATT